MNRKSVYGRRLRLLILAPLAAVCALTSLIGWSYFREDRQLESRGARLVRTSDWYTLRSVSASQWLSDHTLIGARNVPEVTSTHVFISTPNGAVGARVPGGGADLFECDVSTGRITTLPRLSQAFRRTHGDPRTLRTLADGQFVFWTPVTEGAGYSTYGFGYAARPDGTDAIRYRDVNPLSPLYRDKGNTWVQFGWSPDGNQVVEFMKHTIGRPGELGHVPFPPGSPLTRGTEIPGPGAIAPNGNLFVAEENLTLSAPTPRYTDIYEVKIARSAEIVRAMHVALPKVEYVADIQFAPRCNRIAWLFDMDRSPPLPAILERFRRPLRMNARHVRSVWLSNIDGSGMRELVYRTVDARSNDSAICDLQWLPDGQSVSVRVNAALWKIPVAP